MYIVFSMQKYHVTETYCISESKMWLLDRLCWTSCSTFSNSRYIWLFWPSRSKSFCPTTSSVCTKPICTEWENWIWLTFNLIHFLFAKYLIINILINYNFHFPNFFCNAAFWQWPLLKVVYKHNLIKLSRKEKLNFKYTVHKVQVLKYNFLAHPDRWVMVTDYHLLFKSSVTIFLVSMWWSKSACCFFRTPFRASSALLLSMSAIRDTPVFSRST